ncbi:hypothetical protein A2U01_0100236, partial [Trifolium medium]|nr:hypothetical protein [Trifolium medium]
GSEATLPQRMKRFRGFFSSEIEPTLPSEPVSLSEVQRFRGYIASEDETVQRLLFIRDRNTQML